jgi:hypothetical protein
MPVIRGYEIQFHLLDRVHSIIEKSSCRGTSAAQANDDDSGRPRLGAAPLHRQDANRRYHFFKMISTQPVRRNAGTTAETSESVDRPSMRASTETQRNQGADATAGVEITSLPSDQLLPTLAKFRESLVQWEASIAADTGNKDAATAVLAASGSASAQNRSPRLEATHNMLDFMELLDHTGRQAYVVRENGQPIGLMLMSDSSPNHVSAIVTHPNPKWKGMGGNLIEHAVNNSYEAGSRGYLELNSHDEYSDKAFSNLGFEHDGTRMILDPEYSDKWRLQDDEQWRLNR